MIDDVGVSRDTEFQEKRPGGCFEMGGFVKNMLGGLRRSTAVEGEFGLSPARKTPPHSIQACHY